MRCSSNSVAFVVAWNMRQMWHFNDPEEAREFGARMHQLHPDGGVNIHYLQGYKLRAAGGDARTC